MFLGKIEKDTVGFATFLLKLFKTGFGLSVSRYPKCILNVSYSGAPFVFSCLRWLRSGRPASTLRLLNFSILWYEIWMLCNVSIYLSLLESQTRREWYEVHSKNSLLAWGGADWFPRKIIFNRRWWLRLYVNRRSTGYTGRIFLLQ